MPRLLIWLVIFTVAGDFAHSKSGVNLCDIVDIPNCSGVSKQGRRSSSMSLPSPATSANFNPATVSFDKGIGVEAIAQANNAVNFNLASGTGRVGGILISPTLENSFFGNRVRETDEDFLERNVAHHQYENRKLNLAVGGKVVSKKDLGFDLGLILKRHSVIKRVNPGFGVSSRLGPLTLGASMYDDDFYLEDEGAGLEYEEKFKVQTYSVGLRARNFFFDAGAIRTKYKIDHEATQIFLYSLSYLRSNVLYNVALRNEHSSAPEYRTGALYPKRKKNDFFASVQYSFNRHFVVGVSYNYFLLRELSLKTSIFF